MKILWLSAGVSSFMAGYYERESIDKVLYIHIDDQHKDSWRFIGAFQRVTGLEVEILQHEKYKCVNDLIRARKYINGPHGAPCTVVLKKEVRKKWEAEHPGGHTYIWGMDCTEADRADRLAESQPYKEHLFPLIDRGLTKEEAHGVLRRLNVKRPYMYDLGYSNNNCVMCVKGGMGYMNKCRVDFPETYAERAKVEREIGASCLKDKNGPIFLDELDPNRGRMQDEIMQECGIFCQMNID